MKKRLFLLIGAAGLTLALLTGCSNSKNNDNNSIMDSTENATDNMNNTSDNNNTDDENVTTDTEESSSMEESSTEETSEGMLEGAIDGNTITGRAGAILDGNNDIGMQGSSNIIGNR